MFNGNVEAEKKHFLDLLSVVYSNRENLSEDFIETILVVGESINKLKPDEDIGYIVARFEMSLALEANRLTANKLKFPIGYNELFKFVSKSKVTHKTAFTGLINIM